MTLAERISEDRNYQFWALQLAGWTGWVVLFSIRDAYWGQPLERTLVLGIDAGAGIVLTTILRSVYRAVWDKRVAVRVFAVLSASYVAAAIWQPVKNVSQMHFIDDGKIMMPFGMSDYFSGMLGYSYFLMVCWSGLYFALKFYQLLQEERERSVRAESLAHESQLRMLRYQLNPHFLFNTLNAISTLILEKETDLANSMLSKLSSFLRYSLDKDSLQKVDLAHELKTLELYLDIEKVRFDDRLEVVIEIPEEAADALVPSLLLQPLVENSIKYAISAQEAGGTITVNGRIDGDQLVLEVSDDGPGMTIIDGAPEVSGVGLANTHDRLRQLYGEGSSCVFTPAVPHGLTTEIRIPFEKASRTQ